MGRPRPGMVVSAIGEFLHAGHRLVYERHGDGDRVLVFLHGLLLDAALNRTIATRLAEAGYQVILPELLGHGRSDKPTHAYAHRLEFYADQTLALLDHLGLEQVVLGGVSLGANVTLAVAERAPDRLRGMVIEMPVLERGGVAAMALFFPWLLAFRYAGPLVRPFTRLARRLPRTGAHAFDSFLNLASADPREMAAVVHGLFVGGGTPPEPVRRRLDIPALVVGHPHDALHAMDDAVALADELPDARFIRAWSVIETRAFPRRFVASVGAFLDERYATAVPVTGQAAGA